MGVPTRHFAETVVFFRDVLGLEAEREDADFAVLRLPSGEAVEVFGPELADAEQFATAPVVDFEVEDVREAREEMEAKGVEFLGPVHDGDPGTAGRTSEGPTGRSTRSPRSRKGSSAGDLKRTARAR
jgi:catechol 2,3-dioxygenase-like lactoylglutathione lyase family enzyme